MIRAQGSGRKVPSGLGQNIVVSHFACRQICLTSFLLFVLVVHSTSLIFIPKPLDIQRLRTVILPWYICVEWKLNIHASVRPSIHPSIYLSIYPSIHPSFHICTIHLCICLSIIMRSRPSICLSVCLSLCGAVHPSVYISVCLSLCGAESSILPWYCSHSHAAGSIAELLLMRVQSLTVDSPSWCRTRFTTRILGQDLFIYGRRIAPSTAQGHLGAFHLITSYTSSIQYQACTCTRKT